MFYKLKAEAFQGLDESFQQSLTSFSFLTISFSRKNLEIETFLKLLIQGIEKKKIF